MTIDLQSIANRVSQLKLSHQELLTQAEGFGRLVESNEQLMLSMMEVGKYYCIKVEGRLMVTWKVARANEWAIVMNCISENPVHRSDGSEIKQGE